MRGSVQGTACQAVWYNFMSSCCHFRIETDKKPSFRDMTALWYSVDEATYGQAAFAIPQCE
jgi:hypothetical protein